METLSIPQIKTVVDDAWTLDFDPLRAHFEMLHELLCNVSVTSSHGEKFTSFIGVRKAIEIVRTAHSAAKKVVVIGNGGSAAIASHLALDLWNACGIKAVTFNEAAVLTCLSNDYGYENVFSKSLEMFAEAGDVLIAISSSGTSQNILNAAVEARRMGLKIISFSGFSKQAPLVSRSDLNFYVDSDQYGCVEVAHMALTHYLTDVLHKTRNRVEK
ncbi:MAG: SIS domain-containing protein [Candidatus Obscuribacterales bacterium]|nr:SIS domain-containing protein [Candidatus Obscuribacterales bacterium]